MILDVDEHLLRWHRVRAAGLVEEIRVKMREGKSSRVIGRATNQSNPRIMFLGGGTWREHVVFSRGLRAAGNFVAHEGSTRR